MVGTYSLLSFVLKAAQQCYEFLLEFGPKRVLLFDEECIGAGFVNRKTGRDRVRHGFCKLTGKPGAFVKSHLIPEALSRPSQRGAPLIQLGAGQRPSQRWSSWYDAALVTRAGEDVLSDLDTWAIATLREHRLVWSGWGDEDDLGDLNDHIYGDLGIREVELDTMRLRLFFLSLLWRAAASERPEFQEVSLPPADLTTLRDAVLGKVDPGEDFYPVTLTQISTRGLVHNQAPQVVTKHIPNFEDPEASPYPLRSIRFYFDGLIAHFAAERPLPSCLGDLGKVAVGAAPTVVLSTVSFDGSKQWRDARAILDDYDCRGDGLGVIGLNLIQVG